jgi:Ca2+-transporting ATPase
MPTPFPGLSSTEAARRRAALGPNVVSEPRWRAWTRDVLELLSDPMGIMLLILAVVYWVLGERTDAGILLGALVPILGVDALLNIRSHRALAALKKTLSPLCHVIRDGRIHRVPTGEIVPGDFLLLEEGQTLPADGRLRDAQGLTLNEAPLTGESVPVEKHAGDAFLSGTTVLTGRGVGEVEKTGAQSQIGALAAVLKEFESVRSPLQIALHRVIKTAFLIALALAAGLFVVEFLRTGRWGESLVLAMTLAMAAIPEEFPLVFTLYLSLAAWRLARRGVLVKSLPAVEALGGVDVICTDKTGTLTEGIFQLVEARPWGTVRVDGPFEDALIQACEPAPTDALEKAVFAWAAPRGTAAARAHAGWTLTHDYPFETAGKHMSHVWTRADGSGRVAMKGAVEGVLEHCAVSAAERREILAAAEAEAARGRRVLGLAARDGRFTGERTADETGLVFLGLLLFTDPVRPRVMEAIAHCRRAGIEIKMLTGDHPATAHAIAEEIGLEHDHEWFLTGDQIAALPPERRAVVYEKGTLFARLRPEQKMELVDALRARGRRVAMTGDGINDAAALKRADVGVSMGKDATDVARSTAQIVLLRNDFRGITDAVFEGRRVMAGLRASFGYLIAFHTPIFLLTLVPPLLGGAALLRPIHIVLMELIVHPLSALVFDDPTTGDRKTLSLVDRASALRSLGRGVLLTLAAFGLFLIGDTPATARGLAVIGLVFGNIGLVFAEMRGGTGGRALTPKTLTAAAGLMGAGVALALAPAPRRLFQTPVDSGTSLALALLAVLAPLVVWKRSTR